MRNLLLFGCCVICPVWGIMLALEPGSVAERVTGLASMGYIGAALALRLHGRGR